MPDEKGNPVRGEEGHWRFRKDKASGNKFDAKGNVISVGPPEKGTTKMESPGMVKQKTPDPKGVYTKAVATGFNKEEQRNLLKARKVKFLSRDKEDELVKKILKSNPEGQGGEKAEDIPPEPPEERTEGTDEAIAMFTKEQLSDFKAKKLVEILKALGDKRVPFSEKGRITKILKLQKN